VTHYAKSGRKLISLAAACCLDPKSSGVQGNQRHRWLYHYFGKYCGKAEQLAKSGNI